jgi:hypothetical protein
VFGTFNPPNTQYYFQVWVDQYPCSIDLQEFGNDMAYIGGYYLTCTLPEDIPSGLYSVTVMNIHDFVKSATAFSAWNFDKNLNPFVLRVLQSIESLNTNRGSYLGMNLEITTNLEPLEPLELSVKLGAFSCPVSSFDHNVITCKSKEFSDAGLIWFLSGRGLTLKIKYNENHSIGLGDSDLDEVKILNVPKFVKSSEKMFTEVIETMFCPMHSGEYSFLISSIGFSVIEATISSEALNEFTSYKTSSMQTLCVNNKIDGHFENIIFNSNCVHDLIKYSCYYVKVVIESTESSSLFNMGMLYTNSLNEVVPTYNDVVYFFVDFDYQKENETYELTLPRTRDGLFDMGITYLDENNEKKIIKITNISTQVTSGDLSTMLNEKLSDPVVLSSNVLEPKSVDPKVYNFEFTESLTYDYDFSVGEIGTSFGDVFIKKTNSANFAPKGLFVLNVNNQNIELEFGETAESIQNKLSGMDISSNSIEVTTSMDTSQNYKILFRCMDVSSNVKLVRSSLFGGSDEVSEVEIHVSNITESLKERTYFPTVSSDYFRTISEVPTVVVWKLGEIFSCPKNNCDFEYLSSSDSAYISSSSYMNSNTFQIELNLVEPEQNIVDLFMQQKNYRIHAYNSPCQITSFAFPTIQCQIESNPDGSPKIESGISQMIQIEILDFGFLKNNITEPFINPTIHSLSPNTVGINGGNILLIQGAGFKISEETFLSVTIDETDADILDYGNTYVNVVVPENRSDLVSINSVSVSIFVGQGTYSATIFNYDPGLEIMPITLDGSNLEFFEDSELILMGDFSNWMSEDVFIKLVDVNGVYATEILMINSINNSEISCKIRNIRQTNYNVTIRNNLFEKYSQDLLLNYQNAILFSLDNSPFGSMFGGAVLAFQFKNFPWFQDQVQILIGTEEVPCEIFLYSSSTLNCRIQYHNFQNTTSAKIVFILKFRHKINDPLYEFIPSKDMTPVVTSLSTSIGKSQDIITVTGSNFTNNPGNEVMFGNKLGIVSFISTNQLQITVPSFEASTVALSLLIPDKGYAQFM